jgi:hypothetical protein
LLPGPGSITLSQHFTLPEMHGTGYQSMDGHGSAMQQVAVTWI